MDHTLDLSPGRFVLAGRAITTVQLQVLGNIKDNIRIGLKDVDVRSDGSIIVNLTPDMARKLAAELNNLARKGSFNGPARGK